jgi:predicted ArsR family transcriptional regulator
VDELRKYSKGITAVTVRHHLARLYTEQLITSPTPLRRAIPGRPRHVYSLTDKAKSSFPNNYELLTVHLLGEMIRSLPSDQINVIFEGVADRMAEEASVPDVPMPQRLDMVVDYLNKQGYEAYWETCDGGYVLHTANCPYHHISGSTPVLCEMDMRLIASVLQVIPRVLQRVADGSSTCAYMIHCWSG